MKLVFNNKICNCFVSKEANMTNFHPLEAVARGSETQLQGGENLDRIKWAAGEQGLFLSWHSRPRAKEAGWSEPNCWFRALWSQAGRSSAG